MKISRVLIVVFVITMAACPVIGTSILLQQPEVVVKQAPLIVDVIVKEIKFEPIPNLSTGEAWMTLSVVDKIVGDCPSEIVVRRGNVTPDLQFLETEWDPPYSVGEHFVICLFPTPAGYSTMGLYNGKFTVENGVIKGTQTSIDKFKQQVKEIRDGKRTLFPSELPRQTVNGVNHLLKNQGRKNTVMTAGSHLNGEFITWDFTWNTSYVPVQMHYNSSNAPSGAPDANGIASLAAISYSLWADQYSFLTIQNASPFTTSAGLSRDDFSVIVWLDFHDANILAETFTYPNDLQNSVFYGPNSNTGVDFQFNPNIGTSSWYFNQTPPSSRSLSQIDFVEVLAHELGHGIGLQHVSNSNSMMYAYYLDKTCPIRGETYGDLAGRVYQHTTSAFSLSGNIPHSLVLTALANCAISLTANVAVPSGYTLQFESGSPSVSLNSHSILSNGGTISVQSATINDGTFVQSGSTILGIYPSVQAALNAASSGQTIAPWSGTHSINSNLTVPSGITMLMNGGNTLGFTGYFKLRIEGALLASGSSSSPVTFQGNGSPGSWFGIEFYNVSQGSSLRYCTIKDASYGMNLITSYLPPNPLIIRNNNRGVNCTNYSDPSFASTVFDWNNYDVYGDGTSAPLLGTSTGPGYNSFRDPGYYQVYSTYTGTISANGNWWGSSPAYPIVTSNVDYSNWLSTDPNPSMKQTGGKSGVVVQSVSPSSSGMQDSRPGVTSSDSGITQLDAAYRLYLAGNYENALRAFQAVVASYPDNFSGCRALAFAERCLDRLGRSSDVLTELNDVSGAGTGTRVSTFAKARRTYQYLQRGKYQESLAQAVQTAGSSSDSSLVKFALYDAGSINWYDLGNKQSGQEYYRQLISRFPGDPLSASALAAMGETAAPSSPKQQAYTVTEDEGVALRNYPNPFNPTTTISYNLKMGGHVTLRIYDILGREVMTLVDGQESAGLHSVQFNGQNLASGVYLYRLTAPGIEQVKKMILMK